MASHMSSCLDTEMDVQKAEAAIEPPSLPLEQLPEILSSLDIGKDDVLEGETGNDLPLLPFELVIEILSWLPVKPLLRFKCVSKPWYNLIKSSEFVELHLSRSLQENDGKTLVISDYSSLHTFNFYDAPYFTTNLYYPKNNLVPDPCRLVGSCNGLLCFASEDDRFLLYNPATRAYKHLPNVTWKENYSTYWSKVVFVYDCKSNDYKVLRFVKLRNSRTRTTTWETLYYSLRTNTWEIITNPPWKWDTVYICSIVVNNSLHWTGCEHKEIRCFDLFNRNYFEIPLPAKISPGYSPKLVVLRGQLSLVTYYLDIWIMKEYRVLESWTRVFRCSSMEWNNMFSSLEHWQWGITIAYSKDGCKILVAVLGNSPYFICCDLVSKETRKIQVLGLPPGRVGAQPWVESLVPLSN